MVLRFMLQTPKSSSVLKLVLVPSQRPLINTALEETLIDPIMAKSVLSL